MEGSAAGGGLRVGLFGIGLDAYWPQFAGLKERLKGYLGAGRSGSSSGRGSRSSTSA